MCTENEGVHCVFSRTWSEGGGTMKGRIFHVSHLVAAAISSQSVSQSVSQCVYDCEDEIIHSAVSIRCALCSPKKGRGW